MASKKELKRAYQLGLAYGLGCHMGLIIHRELGYNLAMDAAGKWITVGGEEEDTGAKHMYINPYSGKILKGPKEMQGKTLQEGFKDLKELNKKKKEQKEKQKAKEQAKANATSKPSNQNANSSQSSEPKLTVHKHLNAAQVAAIIYKSKGLYAGLSKPKQSQSLVKANSKGFQSSAQAIDAFDNKAYAKTYNSLTDTEKESIYNYSNQGHIKMNESLRNFKQGDSITKEVKDITAAINKASLPSDMVLHRGCSFDELQSYLNMPLFSVKDMDNASLQMCVNRTFTVDQFLSTSAVAHGASKNNVSLSINAPKGTKALWLSDTKQGKRLSKHGNDFEVLMQRGTSFSISKINKTDGKINIELVALKKAHKYVENKK